MMPRGGGEWLKLAMVGVIAVGLAGVGSLIAGSFEDVAPTATTNPVATATEATAAAATTTSSEDPFDRTAAPTTTSTNIALTPLVEVSAPELDLGDSGTKAAITISNSGTGPARWSVSTSGLGLSFGVSSGELAPGESLYLEAFLDRASIEEGEYSALLDIIWDQGSIPVTMVAKHQDNPVIHNPNAAPNPIQAATKAGCSPTLSRISARVRDTSDLAEVFVRWNNGSKQVETAMASIGNDMYEASIGPFVAAGSFPAKVIAVDIHENAGGASVSITANPCP